MTEREFEEFYSDVLHAVRPILKAERHGKATAPAHRNAKARILAALKRVCPPATVNIDAETGGRYNGGTDNLIGASR